jgi:hypothetical protein
MRWSEQRLADHLAKTGAPGKPNAADTRRPPFLPPDNFLALGRLKTGEMNKTEARYDAHLWERRHAGEVLWHKFEAIKLRLADNTFYEADFAVLAADRTFEIHEVKSIWLDDARVKIKVAASLFPFRFIAVRARSKKEGDGWSVEEF